MPFYSQAGVITTTLEGLWKHGRRNARHHTAPRQALRRRRQNVHHAGKFADFPVVLLRRIERL